MDKNVKVCLTNFFFLWDKNLIKTSCRKIADYFYKSTPISQNLYYALCKGRKSKHKPSPRRPRIHFTFNHTTDTVYSFFLILIIYYLRLLLIQAGLLKFYGVTYSECMIKSNWFYETWNFRPKSDSSSVVSL